MTAPKTVPHAVSPPASPPPRPPGTRTSRVSRRETGNLPRFGVRCPPGWVTRKMIMEQTGVTDSAIKGFEQRGLVNVEALNDRNWGLYREEAVEKVRRLAVDRPTRLASIRRTAQEVTYTSREAKDVFVALQEGRTLDQIVIEQDMHPSVVQVIARDYQYVAGAILLLKPVVDEINAMPFDGPRPLREGDDVLVVLRQALRRMCGSCGARRSSVFCTSCTRDRLAALESARPARPRGEGPDPASSEDGSLEPEDGPLGG